MIVWRLFIQQFLDCFTGRSKRPSDSVHCYEFERFDQAELACGLLRSNGISCELSSMPLPGLPADIILWVYTKDAKLAWALLTDAERRVPKGDAAAESQQLSLPSFSRIPLTGDSRGLWEEAASQLSHDRQHSSDMVLPIFPIRRIMAENRPSSRGHQSWLCLLIIPGSAENSTG